MFLTQFVFEPQILFDNSNHDGRVPVTLDADGTIVNCSGNSNVTVRQGMCESPRLYIQYVLMNLNGARKIISVYVVQYMYSISPITVQQENPPPTPPPHTHTLVFLLHPPCHKIIVEKLFPPSV